MHTRIGPCVPKELDHCNSKNTFAELGKMPGSEELEPVFMQTWVDRFREWMASEVVKKLLIAADHAHAVSIPKQCF